jgi:hypothetical protein
MEKTEEKRKEKHNTFLEIYSFSMFFFTMTLFFRGMSYILYVRFY